MDSPATGHSFDPASAVVGFLHPGAMGSAMAAACKANKLWAAQGRSASSRQRANQAGMEPVATLDELVDRSEVIISICPPEAAYEVARSVSALGFDRIYVDANAISPDRARSISELFDRFVDGGVVGPPPTEAGSSRLYLAGPEAETVADLWTDSALDARVIDDQAGSASALKMAYAAWTKGSAALLMSVVALAEAEGVEAELLGEWDLSQPGLANRAQATAPGVGPKGWRFAFEMEEIATTFAAVGLPDGYHSAAADIYQRLAEFKNQHPGPTLAEVTRRLNRRS